MRESLDRSHYQLLLALRDTSQLRRAADRLAISASAASHRLREAERRSGLQLTTPKGRSIHLTPAGLHLADVAASLEATIESAEATARWIQTSQEASVRFALDYYDALPWLPDVFSADSTHRLDLVRVGYNETTSAIESRVADFGLAVTPSAAPDDQPGCVPLGADKIVALVPADHPAADRGRFPADSIAGTTYLSAGRTPEPGFVYERFFEPRHVHPPKARFVDSLATCIQLVEAGHGVCFQPRLALPHQLTDAVAVPLEGNQLHAYWYGLHRPEPNPSTAELIAVIHQCIEQHRERIRQ